MGQVGPTLAVLLISFLSLVKHTGKFSFKKATSGFCQKEKLSREEALVANLKCKAFFFHQAKCPFENSKAFFELNFFH